MAVSHSPACGKMLLGTKLSETFVYDSEILLAFGDKTAAAKSP